jgi:hypothetical protein
MSDDPALCRITRAIPVDPDDPTLCRITRAIRVDPDDPTASPEILCWSSGIGRV